MALFGLFGKEKKEDLDKGLEKTREGLFSRISSAVAGKATVDAEFLDELEEILISSDVGLDTTVKIIGRLEERVARDKYLNTAELQHILREEIVRLLTDSNTPDYDDFQLPASADPYIILVVGVNGVGKTTTIGKLASQFRSQGKKVLLGAADTFRAAAIDQLSVWADRTGVEIIRHQMGADPAAVAFDTVNVAKNKGADVVLIDTAGRLHNKVNLMNELSKIKRVIQKVYPDAPQEVLLVLDASTGQNALEQARHFTAATEVTAIALTKLDGTAKGGVVLGIADQFRIPVKYIGVGEQVHQLQVFNKKAFVDALFHEPA